MKRLPISVVVYFLLFSLLYSFSGFLIPQARAITALQSARDTVTSSRPSAAAPIVDSLPGTALNSTVATVGVVSTTGGNQSRFLASDSAKLDIATPAGPDSFKNSSLIISSQSADLTSIYFSAGVPNILNNGVGILEVPITASHSVTFTTVTQIPANGKVVITFPNTSGYDTHNYASPSASTFQFNNLKAPQINITSSSGQWNPSGGCTIAEPTITCVTSALVSGGTTLSFGIPNLINPTKSNISAGTADQWKVSLSTQDNSSNTLDGPTNVIVNTIEAVTVNASIDSTFTMTIAAASGSLCGDTVPAGRATATNINLGIISSSSSNSAAQLITVSTNAGSGYAITATSSGHLLDVANGAFFLDANSGNYSNNNALASNYSPAPQPIVPGTSAFGIHPCTAAAGGATVPGMWGTSNGTTGGTGNLFANPWNYNGTTYAMTLSSYPTQPPAAATTTYVEYAVTASTNTPAGSFNTQYTYVGTPTF